MNRELLQQALEALEWEWGGEPLSSLTWKAITDIKAELAKPEQEPVAWLCEVVVSDSIGTTTNDTILSFRKNPLWANGQEIVKVISATPLYTRPMQHDKNWTDKLKNMLVSMDVSTGEDDADHRIFGRVCEVMSGSDENTILAIEESRNFTLQRVPLNYEPNGEVDIINGQLSYKFLGSPASLKPGMLEALLNAHAHAIENAVYEKLGI